MNDKYLETTYVFLFLLKRSSAKFLQTSKYLSFRVYLNYKVFKGPISFFINLYIFSLLFYGHAVFDTTGATKLLILLPDLLQVCDHGLFKLIF